MNDNVVSGSAPEPLDPSQPAPGRVAGFTPATASPAADQTADHMTDQTADQMADTAGGQDDHDAECVEPCTATTCFDMDSCDELEAMLIERMRTMLRPQTAPECLYERIRTTLDRCCEERRRQTSSITHVTHVTSVTGMQGTSTSLMHATIIHREVHD